MILRYKEALTEMVQNESWGGAHLFSSVNFDDMESQSHNNNITTLTFHVNLALWIHLTENRLPQCERSAQEFLHNWWRENNIFLNILLDTLMHCKLQPVNMQVGWKHQLHSSACIAHGCHRLCAIEIHVNRHWNEYSEISQADTKLDSCPDLLDICARHIWKTLQTDY